MEKERLFRIKDQAEFRMKALEVFRYQYQYNPVYREFCDHLGRNAASVTEWQQIPYLPIEFFKTRKVICNGLSAATVFTSSGTTGSQPSAHHVADLSVYEGSYLTAFELFYGPVTDFCVLALLPSYLEREGSSLIFMVDDLIRRSGHPDSGFYLSDLKGLHSKLERLEAKKSKVLLIGVSFALLDFAEQFPIRLRHTMVMETGGMKGRRKELVREELHGLLKQGLGLEKIHSEYGMTELLSQAYSAGHGKFRTPPWMQVSIRDPEDPFSFHPPGKTGGINVIDLANINSCSFIATQDLGKLHPDNSFEVLGRFDNSDIRGCNLMLL